MENIENLSREDLLKLIEVYAKNWLAHDGCWFLAVEEAYGLDKAIELDTTSWHRFAAAEARRIMEAFKIPENGGLESLKKALNLRLYSAINKQEIEQVDEKTMIFKMAECRVQKTRRLKGMPDFPCKSVGIVEFSRFSSTIDPRIKTRCLSCPPDPVGDFFCSWEFKID